MFHSSLLRFSAAIMANGPHVTLLTQMKMGLHCLRQMCCVLPQFCDPESLQCQVMPAMSGDAINHSSTLMMASQTICRLVVIAPGTAWQVGYISGWKVWGPIDFTSKLLFSLADVVLGWHSQSSFRCGGSELHNAHVSGLLVTGDWEGSILPKQQLVQYQLTHYQIRWANISYFGYGPWPSDQAITASAKSSSSGPIGPATNWSVKCLQEVQP